jgi:AMP phosphorylase
MKLKVKQLKFITGIPLCIIHEDTAKELSLHVGERVSIKNSNNKNIISIVNTSSEIIKPSEIAVSAKIMKYLHLKSNKKVEVEITEKPQSIPLIKKKIKGGSLNKKEIFEIVKNIANNSLTEAEVAFFVSAVYDEGMSLEETGYLTEAMVNTGSELRLKGEVADKHSLGGVAGNRTTPLVISICATTGLIMPKTSSRSITSASGTADTLEAITNVEFSIKDIKKIIKKTNACMVWGGALGLAPVDDKIIKIEKIVNIDPPAQMLASILSKKISVGSKYVVIDIPFGNSAKVSKKQAKEMKFRFTHIAKKFKLKLRIVLTDGSEPIGNGIGPVLELKDILKVLTNQEDAPKDLREKSLMLSGELLELTKKAKKGKGYETAKQILESGKAFEKFNEIITAQQGDLKKFEKIPKPKFSHNVIAKKTTKIKHIDNKLINKLARAAGSPGDKLAGIYLYKKKGQIVKKGEIILTIYSDSKEKLKHALNLCKKNKGNLVGFC